MAFKCPSCDSKFTRKNNLKNNFTKKHLGGKRIAKNCFLCGQLFENDELLDDHRQNFHKPSNYFEIRESAFKKSVVCYRYIYSQDNMLTPSDAQSSFIKNEIKKLSTMRSVLKMLQNSVLFFLQT
ncbi:MAG: hypothetical protein Q8O34_06075 [Rhodocyclaceae bacterium]|nr:hypothetical protein [Rhodocyclaceae bacterium]